jgi:hypothetical protein
MKSKWTVYLGIGVLSAACGSEPKLDVHPSAAREVDAVPEALGRPHRRMNVDQLKAAMEQVSGGIGWTEVVDGEAVDLFDQLSVTLGRPDYLASTHEELAPGLLFQKFLEDAARSICPKLVAQDPMRSTAERALFVHGGPQDLQSDVVEANLSSALLRFHGRVVSPGEPALDPWVRLHGDAVSRSSPELAWTVVCVALFTHPDFYSL